MVLPAEQPASAQDEASGSSEFSASKFKKVFQKKRNDTFKEGQNAPSSKNGESSAGGHKKSPYSVKLQMLRRRVRKTYPLMEAQAVNLKRSESKQRYAPKRSIDETVSPESAEQAGRLSPLLLSRRHSQPSSDESSESESQSPTEKEDRLSCSYEATDSVPISEVLEPGGTLRSIQTGPSTDYNDDDRDPPPVDESEQSLNKVTKQIAYVNIDMSELFVRPDLEKMEMHRNHLAPCLSPSESDSEKLGKSSTSLTNQGENHGSTEEIKRDGNMKIKASSFHYCDPYFPTLMQDSIRELASSGHFTDVTIEVDGHRMLCHRLILAASSRYFKAMFCNNYREKDQDAVKIEGIPAEMMKVLVRYAYTSYLEISCDNVQNVLEAASQLQFTRVMEACSNYFAGELGIENAPGIMELAQRHNLKPLLVLARLKCVTCFEELREKSDYLTLSPALLESLISRNDLMVSQEEEVFQVVMDWCQYNEERRRKYLPELLRHVKMPLIDRVYFTREIECHPLIRNNPDLFDQMMETRLFHISSTMPGQGKLVPRHNANMHQVFVTVGGCNKNDHFVSEITMLDFQHKTRATLCQLPSADNSARKNRAESDGAEKKAKWAEFGCVSWRGNIVISGGKETKKEVWMFITSLRQWVELGSLNTARWRHRMAVCSGEMYAVGGYDGFLRVTSLEQYNERENVWHEKQQLKEGVSSAAVCECKEKIYVIGGGPSIKVSTEKVQVYSPSTGCWSLTTSMPEPAKCICAVSLDSTIYVAGGTLCHVLTFDTRNKMWHVIGDALACERASCGMTLCNDLIFIVGGRDDEGKAISNVSYLDPKTKQLRSECNLAFGISHHGCLTLQKFDHMRNKNS